MTQEKKQSEQAEFYSFMEQSKRNTPFTGEQGKGTAAIKKTTPVNRKGKTEMSQKEKLKGDFVRSLKEAFSSVFGRKTKGVESLTMAHYICYYTHLNYTEQDISNIMKVPVEQIEEFLAEVKVLGTFEAIVEEFKEYSEKADEGHGEL